MTFSIGIHAHAVLINEEFSVIGSNTKPKIKCGLRGATVARLTPDQKVACSNHVGVNKILNIHASRPLLVRPYLCPLESPLLHNDTDRRGEPL